jgi:hypothetical protein
MSFCSSDLLPELLFAAHRQTSFPFTVRPDQHFFYPDHEATALGCVEQFQHCFPPSPLSNPCTEWGTCNASFSAMYDYKGRRILVRQCIFALFFCFRVQMIRKMEILACYASMWKVNWVQRIYRNIRRTRCTFPREQTLTCQVNRDL